MAALDVLLARPERRAERARLIEALSDVTEPVLARAVAAHRAWAACELGAAGADACAALALEALEDGLLLRDAARRARLPPGRRAC